MSEGKKYWFSFVQSNNHDDSFRNQMKCTCDTLSDEEPKANLSWVNWWNSRKIRVCFKKFSRQPDLPEELKMLNWDEPEKSKVQAASLQSWSHSQTAEEIQNMFSMWHFAHKVVATNCRFSYPILSLKTYFDGVNSKPFQSALPSTGRRAVWNPDVNPRRCDSSGSRTRHSIVGSGFNKKIILKAMTFL